MTVEEKAGYVLAMRCVARHWRERHRRAKSRATAGAGPVFWGEANEALCVVDYCERRIRELSPRGKR